MKTSRNICCWSAWPNAIFYKAVCNCGLDDHTLDLILDTEAEIEGIIFLHIYGKLAYPIWRKEDSFLWDKKFFARILGTIRNMRSRIKACLRLLFIGWLEGEEEFLLSGEKQIEDFIIALREGLELVKLPKRGGSIRENE